MNSLRALSLFRQYFKATQNCNDKHLKLYVRRRIRQDFERNRKVSDDQAMKLLGEADKDLQVIKRQVLMRNTYTWIRSSSSYHLYELS